MAGKQRDRDAVHFHIGLGNSGADGFHALLDDRAQVKDGDSHGQHNQGNNNDRDFDD